MTSSIRIRRVIFWNLVLHINYTVNSEEDGDGGHQYLQFLLTSKPPTPNPGQSSSLKMRKSGYRYVRLIQPASSPNSKGGIYPCATRSVQAGIPDFCDSIQAPRTISAGLVINRMSIKLISRRTCH
ncbi:hypothetical protein GALMADRAFT_260278 [Galerina marginata CBS 339.88]|uniref:Uncharacterized protein n=1 Tax=Galerina marginata (strain CBS 339.88) TaxID=685588 RepID=A0A067SEX9_GALM3|nr:hypothetical protein GALMADRAFT_260278 [Galerina marginata CBS 339.88]